MYISYRGYGHNGGGSRKDKQKKFTFCIRYRSRPAGSALVHIMDAIILHRIYFFWKFQGSYLLNGYFTLRISG